MGLLSGPAAGRDGLSERQEYDSQITLADESLSKAGVVVWRGKMGWGFCVRLHKIVSYAILNEKICFSYLLVLWKNFYSEKYP